MTVPPLMPCQMRDPWTDIPESRRSSKCRYSPAVSSAFLSDICRTFRPPVINIITVYSPQLRYSKQYTTYADMHHSLFHHWVDGCRHGPWVYASMYAGMDGCIYVCWHRWMYLYMLAWMDVSMYAGMDG